MRVCSPFSICLGRRLVTAKTILASIAGALAPFLIATADPGDPATISFHGQTIQVPQYLAARYLAQDALSTIIGDLQQEILAGSVNTVIATGTGLTTLSIPVSPATVAPALSGPLSGTLATASSPGFGNLLKYSYHEQPFFSGGSYNLPASNRASHAETHASSLNGGSVTSSRWNRPMLLEKQSSLSSNLTPIRFFSPDWILVAGDDTNFPGAVSLDASMTASGAKPVVGRYAYTIYDEGGLLDMTVAGYPSNTSTQQIAYKSSLAYADLSQLNSNGSPLLTQTQIDAIVNRRNTNNFTGRQDFMKFLLQDLGTAANSSTLQNALAYLGTFSRDVNQPSYVPPLFTDPNAPTIQPITNGGNNQAGLDMQVNPSFLTIRAQGSFTRADGTTAIVGEPLVKKRFALNRLAWITYKGPSADRNVNDPDIQALVTAYQVPVSFLQQGTAANIQKYFGLTWNADGTWHYDVHNGASGSGPTGTILKLPDIASLGAFAHDPDFFELLKASINAGSKAKTETPPPSSGTAIVQPNDVQSNYDSSFNYSIIQIGANIIEQAKVDGYCVRIVFDDGTGAREFQGVENVPYLYRTRLGVLKIRSENIAVTGSVSPAANAAAGTIPGDTRSFPYWAASQGILKDPGVSMMMILPEIWNPHDVNNSLPSLRPTSFRVVADSTYPDNINALASGYNQFTAYGSDAQAPSPNNSSSISALTTGANIPVFSRKAGGVGTSIQGGYKGFYRSLTPANSAITFQVPPIGAAKSLFREPTLLARYNVPTTSQVAVSNNLLNDPDYSAIEVSPGSLSLVAGQGFKASVTNPLSLPSIAIPPTNQTYVGIPLGLFPSEYCLGTISGQPAGTTNIYRSILAGVASSLSQSLNITFRLQYQDPINAGTWITYDTKYLSLNGGWTSNILGVGATGGLMQGGTPWTTYIDPRTSHFGAINSQAVHHSYANRPYNAPGSSLPVNFLSQVDYASSEVAPYNAKEWIDPTNDVLISNRPGTDAGYLYPNAYYSYITSIPALSAGWYPLPPNISMKQGLYSQNSTSVADNALKYSGVFGSDPNPNTATGPNFYTDADGVVRRAMGGYVTGAPATTTVGLPMAATYSQTGFVANQSQSRPWILHRPFRSVAELGYVFSGNPWKNLDFFTPESGDNALLDVFCVNDSSDPNGLVAGKINLNTRQAPVLKAILARAYSDEKSPTSAPLDSAFGGTTDNIVSALVNRTASQIPSSTGKLANVSELVGRWVSRQTTSAGGAFAPHNIDGSKSYDGFSNDLTSIFGAGTTMGNIQRFREAAVRPLSNVGTTRVWNLFIDVIAQAGNYPATANTLSDFLVQSEQRYWLHVAIDRYTGQVLDQSMEPVSEGPTDIALTGTTIPENQPIGTQVATISATDLTGSGTFTYSLASGNGSFDNGSFVVSGNTLQTGVVPSYFAKSSYSIRLRATSQSGLTFDKVFNLSVLPGPYAQWKISNFGVSANDPSVAGDTVSPAGDGIPNLIKYGLGMNPNMSTSASLPVGGTAIVGGTNLFTYTYSKNDLASDVSFHPEWSNDLATWFQTGISEQILSDDGTTQKVQDSIPLNSTQPIFLRLRITKP